MRHAYGNEKEAMRVFVYKGLKSNLWLMGGE